MTVNTAALFKFNGTGNLILENKVDIVKAQHLYLKFEEEKKLNKVEIIIIL